VADKSDQLILTALSQAVAHADGLPLHGSKASPGLFPASAAGKLAAERCRQDGFLCTVAPPSATPETESARKRKPAPERCTITPKGVNWLLGQVSPREILEGLARAVEGSQSQVGAMLQVVQQMQHTLAALRGTVETALNMAPAPEATPLGSLAALFRQFLAQRPPETLNRFGIVQAEALHTNGDGCTTTASEAIVGILQQWEASGASDDCPLPDLYRLAKEQAHDLTEGTFHDELRRLYACGRIYLHPWPGPLYDIPDPQCALLVGHGIAYYASVRP
jgi:hypothetical protein